MRKEEFNLLNKAIEGDQKGTPEFEAMVQKFSELMDASEKTKFIRSAILGKLSASVMRYARAFSLTEEREAVRLVKELEALMQKMDLKTWPGSN